MDAGLLENAGLTRIEAKVYLSLLDIGASLAGNISRKTGIHRRSVYDALERLIQKGFVSYIKTNNRHYYQAEEPRKIIDIINQKNEEVQKALLSLEKAYKMPKQKQETTFFRGKNGIRAIFDDQLEEGKEVLVISGSEHADEIMKYYLPHYTRERVKRKVKLKILFDENARRAVKAIPLSEVRFLPKGFGSHAATNVYADKVAIILWTEEPIAILIKHNEIADSYRNYFELLWRGGKK